MTNIEELLTALLNGETADIKPNSRAEAYLKNCCEGCGCDGLPEPVTRMDALLYALAEKIGGGGGGSSGSDLDALIEGTITDVTSNATSVRNYLFQGCTALTSANLPNAISVGNYAFDKCEALTSANLPNAISVGHYAFSECKTLTNVNLPNVTSMGGNVFRSCMGLTSINLPKVTNFTSYVFYGCQNLKTLDVSCTTEIMNYAFYNCCSITSIILRGNELCSIASAGILSNCFHFDGTFNAMYNPKSLKDGYFYVPSSLIEQYKSATNWSNFADRFRALEDYTVDGTTTGELDMSKI